MRSIAIGLLGIVLVSGGAAAQSPPAPAPKEIQVSDSRLQFYGFFRQDVIFDGARVEAGHDARADQGDARVL